MIISFRKSLHRYCVSGNIPVSIEEHSTTTKYRLARIIDIRDAYSLPFFTAYIRSNGIHLDDD